MHSTTLVCERFPEGDRGGNSVLVVQGGNLHSLWDNLLGRQDRMADVAREVAELKAEPDLWKVDTRPDFVAWVNESHRLAEETVYDPLILEGIAQSNDSAKINLPRTYLENAGMVARRRIVAAGLRLGVLLGGKDKPQLTIEVQSKPSAPRPLKPFAPLSVSPAAPSSAAKELDHWLNLNGNVRHNASCRFFKNTKNGRACTADEGKPCGICGG